MGPRFGWIEGVSDFSPEYRTEKRCEYRNQYDSELKFTLELNDIKLEHTIKCWMKENLGGSYKLIIETKDYFPTGKGWVYFSRQEDAMAFKLVWL
ncbi:hypothetical protein LCGC14_0694870 [marine sediment metagenome]|uniref:Uncharacterized protein n=1 Tax=marine sediment metagenome TaxID=412755 RepID=A0A0F9R4U4_9ZZZZ